MRYYPSAAGAAEAGFRPCLRCRPEASPGTPAWLGSSTTVSRALRLMEEDGLADASLEDLALRLGIGSRQLRRLFLQHLGATPVAVLQTRRLHFAKRLIDETDLPFTEAALAAGFGSIRRFNSSFRTLYNRTPTELRMLARRSGRDGAGQYRFRLPFRPPFDWEALLAFLAPRAIPGVEAVDATELPAHHRARREEGHDRSSMRRRRWNYGLHFPDATALMTIVERVRRLFDLRADPADIAARLASDPLLAERVESRPGLRVPGAWDGFELAVRAILGQQVSVKGATTLSGRLVRAFGEPFDAGDGLTHLFPTAAALAEADCSTIGLPAARAEAIRQLASAVASGELVFGGVVDPPAFIEQAERSCRGSATGQRNISPCGRWGSRMHFPPAIWAWRTLPEWGVRKSWSRAPRAGVRGAHTLRCICGRRQRRILEMEQVYMESPVGRLLLEGDDEGLCRVGFDGQGEPTLPFPSRCERRFGN